MDLTDVQNEGIVLSICYHVSLTAYKHACNLKAFFAAAGRGIYIPLVPPEARAAFHFALASFMKTAAKLCSFLRSFGRRFRRVKVCCPERRHHPFARLAEQKV